MKRRTIHKPKLRDRRGPGIKSPYFKKGKVPFRYSDARDRPRTQARA